MQFKFTVEYVLKVENVIKVENATPRSKCHQGKITLYQVRKCHQGRKCNTKVENVVLKVENATSK